MDQHHKSRLLSSFSLFLFCFAFLWIFSIYGLSPGGQSGASRPPLTSAEKLAIKSAIRGKRKIHESWYQPSIIGNSSRMLTDPQKSRLKDQIGAVLDAERAIKTASADHLKTIRHYCNSLPSKIDVLKDPVCHAEWRLRLATSQVVGIDMMRGFNRGQRNAFRVIFEDGSWGWFKGCPGAGEIPEAEILGYHLDVVLGFHRVSPAVKRKLSTALIQTLVVKNQEFFDLTYRTDYMCASENELEGVMVGWWDEAKDFASPFHKQLKNETLVKKFRESWNIEIQHNAYLRELPMMHSFSFFVNILQSPGHNEFRSKNVPSLLSIDLDRASFRRADDPKNFLSLCALCKSYYPLGKNLADALAMSAPSVEFRESEEKVLDDRAVLLQSCFQQCIDTFGKDDVLFERDSKTL